MFGGGGDGGSLGGASLFVPTETVEPLAGPLARARLAVAAAHREAAALPRARTEQLGSRLGEIWTARAQLEQLALATAVEAHRQGAHLAEELSFHDWLSARMPWAAPREVADLVAVARHADRPGNAPVLQAATTGRVPLRRAARLVRTLERLRPALPQTSDPAEPEEGSYQHAAVLLLGVASDPDHTDADLAKVADKLLEVALPEHTRKSREKTLHQLRGVNESSLADGSLTRFMITAEAEGAAAIRAVLSSPLAAPQPDADGPDARTAAQRRYDALLTVLERGMTSPEGTPTTAKATMVITLPYDVLRRQLSGPGTTLTGQLLSASVVRRLACQAEIIPMVLGSDSEVLDQGRAVRTVTKGQLIRLWHRDQGCTYPGCSTPPHWCHAHHLHWWSRGGPTDIDNLTLLCARHHTLVHDHDLTATLTPTGARWHRP